MAPKKEKCWKCQKLGIKRVIDTDYARETIIIHKEKNGIAHEWCLLLTQYKPRKEEQS